MNERGRQVLIDAAMTGVRQIKYRLTDETGGFCALGILYYALKWAADPTEDFDLGGKVSACSCGAQCLRNEADLMVHYNNDHGFDFLTIANKMPVTEET